jgi:dephospho-CoA kinase
MPSPLQIGITGGIGSGKSTVAAIFAGLGVPVYDADSHAKLVMTTDQILANQIKREFGNLCYGADGKLDRKYLAAQVFGFPERLAKLNSLVHPRVEIDYQQWLTLHKTHRYILKEAALLFESGSASKLNKVIVVTAPERVRTKRVMNRDGRTETEVKDIINRQWPESQSVAEADYLINNDETTALMPQVLKLHNEFCSVKAV